MNLVLRDFKKHRAPPTAETTAKRRALGSPCERAKMALMGQKSSQNDPPEGVISGLRKGNSACGKGKSCFGKGKWPIWGRKSTPYAHVSSVIDC